MYESWLIGPILKEWLGFESVSGVDPNFEWNWSSFSNDLKSVTINYGPYLSCEMPDGNNGLSNTQTVFNGSGGVNISQLLEIEEMIKNAIADGGVVNEPNKKDFENSAIIGAVKKNRFILKKSDDALVLVCPNTDIKWHLPSISEIPNKLQYKGEVGESQVYGTYWFSTPSDGTLAGSHSQVYIWPIAGTGTVIDEKRDITTHKYRAVRAVTSDATFQNASN